MRRANPEAILQEGIVAGLRLGLPHGWEVVHVPNGGKRSKWEGAMFKRMGVRAGFPDVIILGRRNVDWESTGVSDLTYGVWFLEIKAGARKKPSEVQQEMHDKLTDLGFPVATVWSWDGTVKQCTQWGLPLRFVNGT
jgi:hypothetical protein